MPPMTPPRRQGGGWQGASPPLSPPSPPPYAPVSFKIEFKFTFASAAVTQVTPARASAAIYLAVRSQIPSAERNDTSVLVLLTESAVVTFTSDDTIDIEQLVERLEEAVCAATMHCDVASTVGRLRLRRRLASTVFVAVNRTYDAGYR